MAETAKKAKYVPKARRGKIPSDNRGTSRNSPVTSENIKEASPFHCFPKIPTMSSPTPQQKDSKGTDASFSLRDAMDLAGVGALRQDDTSSMGEVTNGRRSIRSVSISEMDSDTSSAFLNRQRASYKAKLTDSTRLDGLMGTSLEGPGLKGLRMSRAEAPIEIHEDDLDLEDDLFMVEQVAPIKEYLHSPSVTRRVLGLNNKLTPFVIQHIGVLHQQSKSSA